MQCFNEKAPLCTSCHHSISAKAVSSRNAYRHPTLEVLLCKRCYNRITSITASASHLCLWCAFPGKYVTCSKCSANYCKKCLYNNFKEDTVNNITKKKNWTCFRCLPELLSLQKVKYSEALDGMGNTQSPSKSRKRSNSESHMQPSKRYSRFQSYVVDSSDDEMPAIEYNSPRNEPASSTPDYAATKEEIIEKANQLSMLFFEVNQRALKFKNKFATQRCNLKVLQNAFTFKNKLIDATLKTLQIWKEELTNTSNKWEQEFGISLMVPQSDDAKSSLDVTVSETPNDSIASCESESSKLARKKKFNLSLKRSLDTQYTDDGLTQDGDLLEVNSATCDDGHILPELHDKANAETLERPNEVQETEQNKIKSETLAPKRELDDDSDDRSIFSQETVQLNFGEVEPEDSNNLILCETTGRFTVIKSNISHSITNLSSDLEVGEDMDSETSFVFDISTCRSESPPHSESIDSDATEMYDLDVCGDLNMPTFSETQEGSLSQVVVVESVESVIVVSSDAPESDLLDVDYAFNSDLEIHKDESEIGDSETHTRDLETLSCDSQTRVDDSETHNEKSEIHKDDVEIYKNLVEIYKDDVEIQKDHVELHKDDVVFHKDDSEMGDSATHTGDLETLNCDSQTHDSEAHNENSEIHKDDSEMGDSATHTGDLETLNCDSQTHDSEAHNENSEIHKDDSEMGDSATHTGDLETLNCDSQTHDSEAHNENSELHKDDSDMGDSATHTRDLETLSCDSQTHIDDSEIHNENSEIHNDDVEIQKDDVEHHKDDSEMGDSATHTRDLETLSCDSQTHIDDSEIHNENSEIHRDDVEIHKNLVEIHKDDVEIQKDDVELDEDDSEMGYSASPTGDSETLNCDSQTTINDSETHNENSEIHKDDVEIQKDDVEIRKDNVEIQKDDVELQKDDVNIHNDLKTHKNAVETHKDDSEIHDDDSETFNDDLEIHNSDSDDDLEIHNSASETYNVSDDDLEIHNSNSETHNDSNDDLEAHNSNPETHISNKIANALEDELLSEQHEDESAENLKQSNGVIDQHEPELVAAPNDDDDSDDDEAAKRTVTSTDPCCSHNENANELETDISDIASEEMVLETSVKMDIEVTSLIKSYISDTKEKIDFLDVLGLCSNIVEESECSVKEEEEEAVTAKESDRSKTRDAVALLEDDDYDLFDSDVDISTSSPSEDEEEENETGKKYEEQPSLINRSFPTIPQEVVNVLTESRKEEVFLNENVNTEEVEQDPRHQIKPCTVSLVRLEDILKPSNASASKSENSELKEIERLTNLNNLDLKRKGDKSPKKNKLKRRKIIKPSGSPGSQSQTDNSDSDGPSLSMPSVHCPPTGEINDEGVFQAFIGFSGSSSGSDMDASGAESETVGKEKKKKRTDSIESNKENQPDNQDSGKSTPKEPTPEERAAAEKANWKNDPLLKRKLPASESEGDTDETLEGENILSEKTKKKLEALEAKMEQRGAQKLPRETPNSSPHKSENETDEDVALSSDVDDDSKEVKPSIIINDDTDSDIEFISVIKKKSPGMSKPKTSICISSSDDEEDDDDDAGSKKMRRKNIRAILSDETLDEKTKRATLSEKKRSDRLTEKQKCRDNIISQSQILSQEEGLILDVDVETQAPLVVVHPQLTRRFKTHQKEGVRFMWENCYEGVKELQKEPGSGCIIAHCMGLGKSFQVVALVHTLFTHPVTKTKHVLIVCPLSVVLNWKSEFKQGLQGLDDDVKVFCISERHTGIKRRLFIVDKWRQSSGVLVMGYEAYQRLTDFEDSKTVKRDGNVRKALVDPGPDLVVVDEGHLLKNGKTIRTKALMKVKTKRRIILTGTPLQNNLKEYYYMVQFVKPNLLGSYIEYTNRFVNPIMNGEYYDSTEEDIRTMKKRSHVLNKLLKGTVQRYEVQELKAYLPAKFDHVLFIELHIIQAQLYQKYLDILKTETGVAKGTLIHNFHKLHVLWTHPYLLHLKQEQKKSLKKPKEVDVIHLDPEINEIDESPDGWWHGLCPEDFKTNVDYGPKFKVMLSIIRESEKIGDKVLIFSHSILVLDSIESFLQHYSTPTSQWKPKEDYYRMDGTVLPDTRLQLCNRFNDVNNTRTRVFLISNRVGGLGLNLVAANRVILMDVNWNPAYDTQSIFRTYRFGQTKQCYVYRLVSMGTMEEVVYQRQIHKLAVAGRVVDDMQISRHFRSDDLQKMYRLDYNMNEERPPLAVPPDSVLATVIQECEEIFKYHEHQSLLENKPEEELNEDEMKLAWDEFNRENENHRSLQLEEQKRKQMAMQAGPSGVNTFLPGNMFKLPGGLQYANSFKNNPNNNLTMQSFKPAPAFQRRNSTSTKSVGGAAQPEPRFEVVLVEEDRDKQAFNTEEAEFRSNQVQSAARPSKTNELRKQFFHYVKELSQQKNATVAAPTPQRAGINQPNVSHTPSNVQVQHKDGIVIPQTVTNFPQPQAPATANLNLGYVLPQSIELANNLGKFNRSHVKRNVGKAPKNRKQQTAVSGSTAPQPATNIANNQNRSSNIQIVRKTQLINPSMLQAQSSGSVNVTNRNSNAVILKNSETNAPLTLVDLNNMKRKMKKLTTHLEPELSTNVRNTESSNVGLPKNVKPVGIEYVIHQVRTSTQSQPSSKEQKKSTNDVIAANVNTNEIIDLDANIASTSQELIRSLNKNYAVTLSVLDKPGQDMLVSPKIKVNDGRNAISISAIPKNVNGQSSSNDVIEID